MNKQGKDGIEYLSYTFNPVTGCIHSCKDKYCYAEKIARRFGGNTEHEYHGLHILDKPMYKRTKAGKLMVDPYPYGFEPTLHKYRLNEPAKENKPSIIGVVYMGDLFGEWVPRSWIEEVYIACQKGDHHKYIFLTKNPKRYSEIYRSSLDFRINMWLGTTVTDEDSFIWRGADLYQNTGFGTKYRAKRLLSIEPLQGKISESVLYQCIHHVDWVIIGQQTGPGAVPPKAEWVQSIVDECRAVDVPVFVKSPLYQQFPIQEWPEGLK
jgi:protein gp37